MRIDLVTIFPGMLEGPLAEGIVARARSADLVDIRVHDLRAFSDDRHRTVDDTPFGGGPGMVMKAEPFYCQKRNMRAWLRLWNSFLLLIFTKVLSKLINRLREVKPIVWMRSLAANESL